MKPTDSTEPGLSRRTLLRSGIGAALVSVMEPGDAAPAPDERAGPRRTGRTDAADTDDALSVRAAAEWMDREHTPRRLRGNGPPFADRPDLSPFLKDQYDGKHTLFKPGFFDDVSYDMGMAYRTDDEKIHEEIDQHLTEKGLVESHRWSEGQEWRSLRNTLERHERGVRVRLLWLNTTMLIWPDHGYINHEDRAEVFGTVAGSHGYDVAAFSEVFKRGHARTLADAYDQASPKSTRWAHHQDPRLLTAIGLESGDSDGVRRIPTAGWAPFFHQWAEDGIFQGFQRRTLDTSRSQGVHGVDLFTTHLQPNERGIGSNRGALGIKGDQLRNLATWIGLAQGVFDDPIDILRGRYGDEYLNFLEKFWEGPDRDLIDHPLFDQRPEAPTIVVGDFNFASDQDYGSVDANVYDLEVLTGQFSSLGLQDAWTTHGGPAGGTIGVDVTRRDDDGVEGIHDGKPYPGGRETPAETCHSVEFFPNDSDENVYEQNRLDYVFIEKPKPAHDVTVDVSRMWRVPFSLDCPGIDDDVGPYKSGENRLIDHAGLGVELLVTPK